MVGLLTGLGAAGGFLIGGPAGAGIGASIGAGLEGQQAASDAASTQAASAQSGIDETARQFDITQANLQPFQDAGVSALAQQQALMGMGGADAQQAAFAAFAESPAQSYLRQQQERALVRNSSAIGGLGGGNVRTALQKQAFNIAQTDYNNQFARLGQIAGQGQAAVTSGGQFGANAAANTASLLGTQGEARASGILGQQQALGGTVNNIAGIAGQAGMFSSPSVQAPQFAAPLTQPSPTSVWT